MIRIEKASAGSGKTFTLSHTYLNLLKNRFDYRHILAVTFTNKATAEMKERILRDLKHRAEHDENARIMLTDLLHDYSAFSVSTIDRFFQRALKAFAKELGHLSDYRVELDKDALVQEAMDRILDSLTEDNIELLQWLRSQMESKLSEGKWTGVEKELYDMGSRLKSAELRNVSDGSLDFSQKRFEAIRKSCEKVIEEFHRDVLKAAGEVPITNGHIRRDLKRFLEPHDIEYVMTCPAGRLSEHAAGSSFMELFEGQRFVWYNTARLLRSSWLELGLASQFFASFDAMLKEKGLIYLDDSNSLLKKIIAGSDTPFVYEKLGVRYNNFLLDEFQDTSRLQWDNFLPLLKESNDAGGSNLIVGDVKQSIYRWRDSDWDLLESGVQAAFPDADVHSSEFNWRSVDAVRNFNNEFFSTVKHLLGKDEALYKDVVQKVSEKKEKDPQDGYVKVSFCDLDEEIPLVLDSIRSAQEAGAGLGDITILVRGNDEGILISQALIENGISVISEDSLDVNRSPVVRQLIALLSSHLNKADGVSDYMVREGRVEYPEGYNSALEFCEQVLRDMQERTPELFTGQSLFVNAFMDKLRDWEDSGAEGLGAFLEKWKKDDKHRVGTPDNANSVRVLTVHKAKGLEAPYVIFPFVEEVKFYKYGPHWCRFDASGTPFCPEATGPYHVNLSGKIIGTAFEKDYLEEKQKQFIDALNIMYVALTRAKKSLHIIGAIPSELPQREIKDACRDDFSDFGQVLFQYCSIDRGLNTGVFEVEYGSPYDFTRMPERDRKDRKKGEDFVCSYSSFEIGDRLRLTSQAGEFFDSLRAEEESARETGIRLHDIMSRVKEASDLDNSLAQAVQDGIVSVDEYDSIRMLLQKAIASRPEFFPSGAEVRNEEDIFNSEGETLRPDRVLIEDGRVTVIDYKFGEDNPSYRKQVSGYMDLYRQLGYKDVKGYLWYVYTDKVVEVGG